MPPQVISEEDCPSTSRAFQPFVDPQSPYFEESMAIDLYALVTTRNMHARNHMPTCFKYSKTQCRTRFPRTIISESTMDPETGLIRLKRDHAWVNPYNSWITIMLRANHDCQFLFSQIHALCSVNYVMKYITKREQSLHAKLTIAAAVRKEMVVARQQSNATSTDPSKSMLIKLCNKLQSHREVGLPEAISHLLDFPDHYTKATFIKLHTKHLLSYIAQLWKLLSLPQLDHTATQDSNHEQIEVPNDFDVNLMVNHDGKNPERIFTLVSSFNDYCYQGPDLANFTLYD